jgi:hypothetical protein
MISMRAWRPAPGCLHKIRPDFCAYIMYGLFSFSSSVSGFYVRGRLVRRMLRN